MHVNTDGATNCDLYFSASRSLCATHAPKWVGSQVSTADLPPHRPSCVAPPPTFNLIIRPVWVKDVRRVPPFSWSLNSSNRCHIYIAALTLLTWEACAQPLGNKNENKSEKGWWQQTESVDTDSTGTLTPWKLTADNGLGSLSCLLLISILSTGKKASHSGNQAASDGRSAQQMCGTNKTVVFLGMNLDSVWRKRNLDKNSFVRVWNSEACASDLLPLTQGLPGSQSSLNYSRVPMRKE